ncbi:MAG: hypothetical protein ACOYME_10415 [Prochlorotrichaceae cyanobacterium]|jgi:Rps23 Pro-64 3,4-dihydroxylase Tpa1-like proline 4-hydroxylase
MQWANLTDPNSSLDLTDEELDQLLQGVSESMADKGSALVNLQTLSDDDLTQLVSRIQEEQERRKWHRVNEVLKLELFSLSVSDLRKVQDLLTREIQKREASPLASDGYGDGDSAKDTLTGQYNPELNNWVKRSSGQAEDSTSPATIDVQVCTP